MALDISDAHMVDVGDEVKQSDASQAVNGNVNRRPAHQIGFKPCMVWLNELPESVTYKQLTKAIDRHQEENAGGRLVLVKPRREQPVRGAHNGVRVFFRNRELRNELIDGKSTLLPFLRQALNAPNLVWSIPRWEYDYLSVRITGLPDTDDKLKVLADIKQCIYQHFSSDDTRKQHLAGMDAIRLNVLGKGRAHIAQLVMASPEAATCLLEKAGPMLLSRCKIRVYLSAWKSAKVKRQEYRQRLQASQPQDQQAQPGRQQGRQQRRRGVSYANAAAAAEATATAATTATTAATATFSTGRHYQARG